MKLPKINNLLLYYQCALATGAVFIFFTNLDTYMEAAVAAPSPKLWIIAFAVASLPLFLSFYSRLKYISVSLLVWLAGYMAISIIYFGLGPLYNTSSDEFRTRILTILFILIMSLIFSKYSLVQICARRAILIVSLINVVVYFYGLVNPSAFVTIVEHQSAELTGRPSGFYVDANRAGCALVSGIVFSVSLLPKKYRVPFVLIIFTGIFVTFSRSAPLTLLVVLAILIVNKEIPREQLFLWAAILGVTLISISMLGGSLLDVHNLEHSGFLSKNAIDRIVQFEAPFSQEAVYDESGSLRLYVAQLSWNKFLERPFFGMGIGYGLTYELVPGIRPHNMYLLYMLEHGFLGSLILPLLVLAVTHNASQENQTISSTFAALILIWGIFSHNILEHREFLLLFSLMAAMNTTLKLEKAIKQGKKHENYLCDY